MQVELFEDETIWLARMRKNWQESIKSGSAYCPCCERSGRINKYSLTKTLVLTLRWIMIHGTDDGWVNVQKRAPRWVMRSKNYSLLEHWGFVESKKFRSGVWRVTPKGASFVHGHISEPMAVYTYDNKVIARESTETTFRGCFDKNFDFEAMMSESYDWANAVQERQPKPKRSKA